MKSFLKYGLIILSVCLLAGCAKSIEQQVREQLELGNQYLLDLDYENAVVAFEKVIELEDRNPEAYLGLGQAYQGWAEQLLGEENAEGVELFEMALDSFAKAEELGAETEQVSMGQAASYQVLAQWHFDQDDYQLAEDYCKEILKREPENEEAERILQEVRRETDETAPPAAEETQEAETEIEPSIQDEIYLAYYNKLMELQAQYGEAEIIKQYNEYGELRETVLIGLCWAKLLDFDANGQEELILIYNDGVLDELGSAIFTLEVWEYRDSVCQKLFEIQLGISSQWKAWSSGTELCILRLEGKCYLIQRFMENWETGNIYWGLEDGTFVKSMVWMQYDADGNSKGWINGIEVPVEELEDYVDIHNVDTSVNEDMICLRVHTPIYTYKPEDDYEGAVDALENTINELQATYSVLSTGRNLNDNFILGTWENESARNEDSLDSYASAYYTTFYEDGSVVQTGYRNRDEGTYQMAGPDTAVAIFSNNMWDDPMGYIQLEDYEYTVTYQYDRATNTLYADYSTEFEEAVNSNAGDGVLYKQ